MEEGCEGVGAMFARFAFYPWLSLSRRHRPILPLNTLHSVPLLRAQNQSKLVSSQHDAC